MCTQHVCFLSDRIGTGSRAGAAWSAENPCSPRLRALRESSGLKQDVRAACVLTLHVCSARADLVALTLTAQAAIVGEDRPTL